jgi:hypothetical protein
MSALRDFWNNVVGTDADSQDEQQVCQEEPSDSQDQPQVCQEEPPGFQDQPQVCQDNGGTTPADQTPAADTSNQATSPHRPLPDSTDPDFPFAYQSGFLCGQQGEGPTSRWSFEDRPYLLPEYDRGYQDGVAAAQRSPQPPDRPPTAGPSTGIRKKKSGDSGESDGPDDGPPEPVDPKDPFGRRSVPQGPPEPESEPPEFGD